VVFEPHRLFKNQKSYDQYFYIFNFSALLKSYDLSFKPFVIVGIDIFSPCCDKDSAIIFPTGRLTSTLLGNGVGADLWFNEPFETRRSSRFMFLVFHPMTFANVA
jgi:hypothetical protein